MRININKKSASQGQRPKINTCLWTPTGFQAKWEEGHSSYLFAVFSRRLLLWVDLALN